MTTGDWQPVLKNLIDSLKIKVLYDALGGGDVQEAILKLLPSNGTAYIYGLLENKPTKISCYNLIGGLTITGFYNLRWFQSLSPQEMAEIGANYSNLLKNELSSATSK